MAKERYIVGPEYKSGKQIMINVALIETALEIDTYNEGKRTLVTMRSGKEILLSVTFGEFRGTLADV